ncbi:hypothetical protein [Schlesneria paludicola]|uniref:hypothetical protein n=1 Tax=Schlesneria paludicola TaxID=360056 RepID=UPI00029ABEE1|nr:hypothetical protein [Schlesneria paludicola]
MPILQSLLLADHIYRDQATGKHIICGVFSTIFFTPNPSPDPPPVEPNQRPMAGDGSSLGGLGRGSGSSSLDSPQSALPSSDDIATRSPGLKNQPLHTLMQAGSPYAYFSVTELTGRKVFEVRYVELRGNQVLFNAEVPIECHDPLQTIEVALPLPRLPLVAWEERVYALEIVCEGQLLGSHRVLARIAPAPTPPVN